MIKEEAIAMLSDIRSDYNCFDENEEPKYHALSMAIEALRDKLRTTDDVKNELLVRIVNNSPICQNCDIYRDGWNVCFMASECLTNGFKFSKRRKDEEEE